MNRNQLIATIQQNVTNWCMKTDHHTSTQYKKLHSELKKRARSVEYYSDVYRDMQDQGVALIQDEYAEQLVQPLIDAIDHDDLNLYETQWATSWGIVQHADGNSDLTLLIPVLYTPYQFGYINPLPDYRYRQTTWSPAFVPNPVLFIQGQLHSLACYKRPTKPFLGIIIDYTVNDQVWQDVDPNFEIRYD